MAWQTPQQASDQPASTAAAAGAALPQQGWTAGCLVTPAVQERDSQILHSSASTPQRLLTPTEVERRLSALQTASKEQLEVVDLAGQTLLHIACSFGDEGAVDVLLARRVSLDARAAIGATPLLLAVEGGHAAIVRKLLAKGACVALAAHQQLAPVHSAARRGDAVVLQLLLSAGADPAALSSLQLGPPVGGQMGPGALQQNASSSGVASGGTTPLHFAAYYGHVDVVQHLLSAGVAVDAVDVQGGYSTLLGVLLRACGSSAAAAFKWSSCFRGKAGPNGWPYSPACSSGWWL